MHLDLGTKLQDTKVRKQPLTERAGILKHSSGSIEERRRNRSLKIDSIHQQGLKIPNSHLQNKF